jgi:hypothetical protein
MAGNKYSESGEGLLGKGCSWVTVWGNAMLALNPALLTLGQAKTVQSNQQRVSYLRGRAGSGWVIAEKAPLPADLLWGTTHGFESPFCLWLCYL